MAFLGSCEKLLVGEWQVVRFIGCDPSLEIGNRVGIFLALFQFDVDSADFRRRTIVFFRVHRACTVCGIALGLLGTSR